MKTINRTFKSLTNKNELIHQIEEYLLSIERLFRGKELLFVIGADVWDFINWHGEYYQEDLKRKFSFESKLKLWCSDGIYREFEYYVDNASDIDNDFKYDQQIRVFTGIHQKKFDYKLIAAAVEEDIAEQEGQK